MQRFLEHFKQFVRHTEFQDLYLDCLFDFRAGNSGVTFSQHVDSCVFLIVAAYIEFCNKFIFKIIFRSYWLDFVWSLRPIFINVHLISFTKGELIAFRYTNGDSLC